jgi:hypothetical protein
MYNIFFLSFQDLSNEDSTRNVTVILIKILITRKQRALLVSTLKTFLRHLFFFCCDVGCPVARVAKGLFSLSSVPMIFVKFDFF